MAITVRLPFWSVGQQVTVTQQPGEGGHRNHTHQSWDFALGYAHRVRAIADGVVVDMRETVPDGDASQLTADESWGSGAIGNMVTLKHVISGKTFYSSHFHLRTDKVPVEIGDTVKAGDEIGQVGHTGIRSGAHIHMQVSTELIGFGATQYGWDSSTDNGAIQLVADAEQNSANEALIRFEGYGTSLPGSVIGPPPTVFTDDADIMQLATPGYFEAGRGNDHVTGSSRADHVLGQQGDDTMLGLSGRDRLTGGTGEDELRGGGGNDRLLGGGGKDILKGGPGHDRLAGGAGDDELTGGGGVDVFRFKSGGDVDRVKDFQQGTDLLQLSAGLWAEQELTAHEVLRDFAKQVGDHVQFDFGNGDGLIVENSNISGLVSDLLLVS